MKRTKRFNALHFREAQVSDSHQMGLLDADGEGKWSSDLVRQELLFPLGRGWLAFDEELLGFVLVRMVLDEWEIIHLLVSKTVRGRGIGKALMKHALAEIVDRGGRRVFLEVREGNRPAQALYKSLGFRECGRRLGYYSNPQEDARILRLEFESRVLG